MKGIFNSRPSFPKYMETWDPSIVLDYLKQQSPANKLNLRRLTLKLVTLLAILTGQRTQTLHLIKYKNVKFNNRKMTITIDNLLKTSKPGHHLQPIVLQNYVPNRTLCAVGYMKEYLKRTENIRSTEWLFISTQQPHGPISKSTVANWIRETLKSSGINTDIYGPHSTRSAATSAAIKSMPIEQLMGKVGWKSTSTFQKYYHKPVARDIQMDHAILDQSEAKANRKKQRR